MDYGKKSGRQSNTNEVLSTGCKQLSLYKHVNVLEHLRGNAFTDTRGASRDCEIDG